MQKVTVQIDWYTKVVLTLIAVLLAGLLAKPYIVTKPVGARNEFLEGYEEGMKKEGEIYKKLLTPPSDEYSKKARANKGEYSILSTGAFGEFNVVWVLEKHTGRLTLLAVTGLSPSYELEIISDDYLDEILKWDRD